MIAQEVQQRITKEGMQFHGISKSLHGGKTDGERFYLVSKGDYVFWISDSRPGYFRDVMVPIDFEHPQIIP